MKQVATRVFITLLIFALIIGGALCYMLFGLKPPQLTETFTITFSGGEPESVSSAEFANAFNEALASAKRVINTGGEKSDTITLIGDKAFGLYAADDGLYVSDGFMSYIIDSQTAAALAEAPELAALSAPKSMLLDIGGTTYTVAPEGGRWSYLGIDGKSHNYKFNETADKPSPVMTIEGDKHISFNIEGALSAGTLVSGGGVDSIFGVSDEFDIKSGDVIKLVSTAEYESPNYNGSLSFYVIFNASGKEYNEDSPTEPEETEAPPEESDSAPSQPDTPAPPPIEQPEPEAEPSDKGSGDTIFSVSTTSTYPGEMLSLKVTGATAAEVTCTTTLRAPVRFFDSTDGAIALIPIRLSLEPGMYQLSLSAKGENESWTIAINSKKFDVQYLEVEQSTANETILSQQANNEYNQKIEPLKKIYDAEVYNSGSFVLPAQGSISTEFGMMRYTNGDPVPSYHAAIDIAAAKGSEVKATNAGRVLFSEYIALTGNTILIEHGIGLKSWYYHMDSLTVKEGDMVAKGQVIGTVGSTGFSTGPHLHFGMSVGEYYINPWSFIEE